MRYLLPNHEESTIADPLSVLDLDSEDGRAPYWPFLQALFKPVLEHGASSKASMQMVAAFRDMLETLWYSLNGRAPPDCAFELLFECHPSPSFIDGLLRTALKMPDLFPNGSLPVLSPATSAIKPQDLSTNSSEKETENRGIEQERESVEVKLSSEQVACLFSHMTLGTLRTPEWMTWEGPNIPPIWFSDDGKGSREIKLAYTKVLLAYLDYSQRLLQQPQLRIQGKSRLGDSVTYRLLDFPSGWDRRTADNTILDTNLHLRPGEITAYRLVSEELKGGDKLIRLQINLVDLEDDDLAESFSDPGNKNDILGPNSDDRTIKFCQVVSANKDIGFGQAATQEERLFGAVPCLLPAVLFTPTLSPTQGLLVDGHTVVHAQFQGHLRTAHLNAIHTSQEAMRDQNRIGRSFLFLDALEMDGEQHGRDTDPPNLTRELVKLVTGFRGLVRSYPAARWMVVVPPWGCGTFGGDLKVKLFLIWIAASLCGIDELRFAIRMDIWNEIDAPWRAFIQDASDDSKRTQWTPDILWNFLSRPGQAPTFDWSSLRSLSLTQ